MPSKPHPTLGLLAWLLLTFATAALGGLASANAGPFYTALIRPTWAPPGWLFAPVWTLLYAMMGVSAWLVWRKHGWVRAQTALFVFILQLLLNALWTWVFFVWQQGGWALAEIVLLWLLIATTLRLFWPISRWAAVLLIPYLAWVSFACVLTLAVWQRNPGLLG